MLSFTIIRLGDAAMVWANCPLGDSIAPKLAEALHQLIDTRAARILVDLVAVPSVDTGVVTVLAATAQRLGSASRKLELRMPARRSASVHTANQLRQAIALAYPAPA
jgi:anti-anti-sigma regulatory factor